MIDENRSDPRFHELRALLQDLARVPTLDEALPRILQAGVGNEADCAGIYVLEEGGAGRLVAALGVDEAFRQQLLTFSPDSQRAAALRAAQRLYWDAASVSELQLPTTGAGPLKALLADPVLVDGRPLGLVIFGSRSADAFSPAARDYFGVLAALAAASMMRAAARRDLERREALFRSMYQKAPLPYQSLNAAGEILEVNEAWELLFGYRRDEVLGHNITEFLDESSLPTLMSEFPRFQERGYVNGPEFVIHPREGSSRRITVTGRASYDDTGNFMRTHCLLTDVTEARRVDEEMRALLAEKQLILDNVMVGLAVFRNRHFVACNPYFESLLGYESGQLIGQSARIIHRSDEHFTTRGQKIYEALSEGRNFTEEEAFVRKDGELIWLHVAGRASDPGQPAAEPSVWIFVDLSDRRQAEEEVRELNASLEARVIQRTAELEAAMHDMEAYSYSISHDLRAPLRAINGFAQLLQERLVGQLDPENAAMFERIIRNSKKMGDLIDDILEYSRLGRIAMLSSPVDLAALARGLAEELREAHPGTRVELGDLPVVEGDPTMLRQVMENLINNAFKYSAPVATPVVRISGAQSMGEKVVSVSDNGVGFDMQHAGRLFGVFQRLHPEQEFRGTGVGLAIVKRLVERHGGRVWAEAAPGRGARFSFCLPERRDHASKMGKEAAGGEIACNSGESRA